MAVSGGVDSMVLLHMLWSQVNDREPVNHASSTRTTLSESLTLDPPGSLIVAHFDHGIRPDSIEDRKLVQKVAAQYGLPFGYEEGKLGPDASEATARRARYAFLDEVKRRTGARAIITAHHNDDVLETAVINLIRGTKRRGMSALGSSDELLRPLLAVSKADLLTYARAHGLEWREDSTNADSRYLRNYIRHDVLPRMSATQQTTFAQTVEKITAYNAELEALLDAYLMSEPDAAMLSRARFIALPHDVAREVMAAWLRRNSVRGYDHQMLDRLVIGAKTHRAGARLNVGGAHWLEVSGTTLALAPIDR